MNILSYTAQRRETSNAQDRVEPCNLSSSLYYGGQDVYPRSTTNQTYPTVSILSYVYFANNFQNKINK